MATNGMTINGLNPLSALTADDKIPVWDTGASGEPTKEITASNLAASVKSLGSLIGTGDLDSTPTEGSNKAVTSGGTYTAIAQRTAKTVILSSNTGSINKDDGYAFWSIGSLQLADITAIKNIAASVRINGDIQACYGAGWNNEYVFVFFKPGITVTIQEISAIFTVIFT